MRAAAGCKALAVFANSIFSWFMPAPEK